MDWSDLFELVKNSEINLFLLIPFGVAISMAFVCFCYHCHQCTRDRRIARYEEQKLLLDLPLSRLSITPGCSIVASTKLTHSRNSADNY
ncbi:hemotin [Drosophila takahashii]|uniref:hemotin n=1 Tax=Drosophila takahashii TaxID=29030 RepID=UPI001CF8A470|nr:hemotin [Drosophila takahashii]